MEPLTFSDDGSGKERTRVERAYPLHSLTGGSFAAQLLDLVSGWIYRPKPVAVGNAGGHEDDRPHVVQRPRDPQSNTTPELIRVASHLQCNNFRQIHDACHDSDPFDARRKR